jgi:NAD kinase
MIEIDKIAVITKKTPLEDLVDRLNSRAQARFYLEQNQVPFAEYERADAQYHQSVDVLLRQLPRSIKHIRLDRELLPGYQFGPRDLAVTIGPDGLVINVAKYLDQQPILAFNPDPARIDGVLIPFQIAEAGDRVARALRGDMAIKRVSMARAQLNDGQTLYAVNDLFIGPRSHGSALPAGVRRAARAAQLQRDHRLDRRRLHRLAALDRHGRMAGGAALRRRGG